MAVVVPAPAADADSAQEGPGRPITVVVPAQAGGTIDLIGRAVGDILRGELEQTVVIENRVGAGTIVGSQHVARAAPDGHTLLVGVSMALATATSLYPKVGLQPERDLLPVTRVVTMPNVVVVRGDSPSRSLADFVAAARQQPGQLNYASPGAGTSVHLATELFKSLAGVDLVHVPYKSSPPGVQAVLTGDVQVAFENIAVVLPLVRSGKLRALAVTTAQRTRALPEVPTVAEQGWPDYAVAASVGVLAPAGTPEAMVRRLDAALQRGMAKEETRQRIEALGMDSAVEGPAGFRRVLRDETTLWGRFVQRTGIQAP